LLDHRCIAGDGTSSCTADELSMSAYGVSVIDFSERGGCHAQA
jgi:hypothetical protein